jgi:Fe2+ transport system protein FeoA
VPEMNVADASVSQPVALAQLRTGESGSVCDTSLCGEDGPMLRAMGLKPNAEVRMCRGGASCIIEVRFCDGPWCRLGLSRRIAKRVMVGRA